MRVFFVQSQPVFRSRMQADSIHLQQRNSCMKTTGPRLTLVLLLSLISCSAAFAQVDYYPLQYREYEAIPFVGATFIPDFQFSTRVVGNDQVSSRTVGMRY